MPDLPQSIKNDNFLRTRCERTKGLGFSPQSDNAARAMTTISKEANINVLTTNISLYLYLVIDPNLTLMRSNFIIIWPQNLWHLVLYNRYFERSKCYRWMLLRLPLLNAVPLFSSSLRADQIGDVCTQAIFKLQIFLLPVMNKVSGSLDSFGLITEAFQICQFQFQTTYH